MPSVVIIHNSLNALGGGERLALATIEALKETGWEVGLATVERTDWAKIASTWGRVVRPDREHILRIPLRGFTIYKRLLTGFLVPSLKKKYDVVINTHGDVMLTDADITYMHFPTFLIWDMSYSKYERGFWRLYFTPYYLALRQLVKRHINSLLLTNSSYSRAAIMRTLKKRAIVVYPPVNVEKFIELEGKRENTVVSIGRFSWEKRYETVVELAKRLPTYQFYIIGSVSEKQSKKYYEKIREMIERHELKNIELLPNAPDKKLLEILSSAKVYLHAMVHEHFGIAVVEGMAAGLVPVVHKSGGPWHDIIAKGKYGYGYNDEKEAERAIKLAISRYEDLSPIVRRRAQFFDKEMYKRKIVCVVERYAKLSR